jgi:N-acetylglucosaminyldiphosphoundecaprenol N-acetyl-beta-D-mannosaminyltransferase
MQLLKILQEKEIISRYSEFKHEFTSIIVFNTEAILYFYKNKFYREYFIKSSALLIDGVFLQIFCRLRGIILPRYHGPDFMYDILCNNHWKKVIIGGSVSNNYFLKTNQISEFYTVPYSDDSNHLVNSFVTQYNFNKVNQRVIIFVSLGLLKQELFALNLLNHIKIHYPSKVSLFTIIPVGAAADFLSGNKPRTNKFIQKIGLEWLVRLFYEPRMLPRNINSLKALIYLLFKG